MNSSQVGIATVAKILEKFTAKGWVVSLPFGDKAKYDLVVDTGKKLLRVQCKTGRVVRGSVTFKTYSETRKAGVRKMTAYTEHADLFAVYCSETDNIYLVPVDKSPVALCSLRIVPAKNGQNKGVRSAAEFEFERSHHLEA